MSILSIWMRAVRIPTLTASFIPIVLGGFLAYNDHSFIPIKTFLATVAMMFLQITSNLINDIDDFNNKVDTKDSLGSSRVIVDNLLSQTQVMVAGVIFFIIAVAIGIYLSIISGPVILFLGLLGAASAYFYTRKPFQFKYKGYGIPLIFLMFGPLPVLGSYYLATGMLSIKPVLMSIPIGLLTSAILHANDLRDIEYDAKAGIKSFAMLLGNKDARVFYLILIVASFLFILIFVLFSFVTLWSLLVFLAAPFAITLFKASGSSTEVRTLDNKTAGLQMVFGLLFLISLSLKGLK